MPVKSNRQAALITGASSGLGRELSILFSENFHVILSGRSQSRLDDTQSRCKDPENTTLVCGDLMSTGVCLQLAGFADLYRARYLICCAGEHQKKPLLDTKWWDNEQILNSNLAATIKLVRMVAPVLLRQNGDKAVININSTAGKGISPEEAAYSASKHGLAGFFKAFRLEIRERGLRVMEVYLGGMRSGMTRLRKDFGYLIDPKDVAELIYHTVTKVPASLQIEEFTLGKFNVPE